MATVSESFTALGDGAQLLVRHGESFTYDVSGTFVGTVILQRSDNGGASFTTVASASGAASGTIFVESTTRSPVLFHFKCTAYTSGTIVAAMTETLTEVFYQLKDNRGVVVFEIVENGVRLPKNLELVGTATGSFGVGGGGGGTLDEAKRYDNVTDSTFYHGWAVVGANPASAVWKICKVTLTGDDAVTTWADGNTDYDNVWNDRASLSYS